MAAEAREVQRRVPVAVSPTRGDAVRQQRAHLIRVGVGVKRLGLGLEFGWGLGSGLRARVRVAVRQERAHQLRVPVEGG